MKAVGIIPARYASSRFPGKPLVEIDGKSMIQRVYEQAKKAASLSIVIVATDDERIESHVNGFGGEAVMTSSAHQSGTDRCAEVAGKHYHDYDVAVNIQGDEPFINPAQIDHLISCFTDQDCHIATLVKKIDNPDDLSNPNKMKVVSNAFSEAIYFSRSAIPFCREQGVGKQSDWLKTHPYYKHIGIYAYRIKTLLEITKLLQSPLEITESLEQLRWIENGYKIKIKITDYESDSVDTPEDLEKLGDKFIIE
ncbi:MAG: 3-deoxy-manno-octulosonate cytidylyltransferase [Flavobacteriales bacterium]|nr:3-deoxy-manno-octulosonate cytidylyltransferase [Bacteroidales bacterium AH-315-I05]PCJ84926.1 MAG: 3-deoxy-manno-octulosonate cytidylyltransferase [Flavobacteriales bacterium]